MQPDKAMLNKMVPNSLVKNVYALFVDYIKKEKKETKSTVFCVNRIDEKIVHCKF